MDQREKLSVYFCMNNRYYLLFNIIQMGKDGEVDLKITDFYNNFIIETASGSYHEDGSLSEKEIKESHFIKHTEISYHKDGSFLRKNKDRNISHYYNPYGQGQRWTPTSKITDFQPILNIAIRRMAIYNTYRTHYLWKIIKTKIMFVYVMNYLIPKEHII